MFPGLSAIHVSDVVNTHNEANDDSCFYDDARRLKNDQIASSLPRSFHLGTGRELRPRNHIVAAVLITACIFSHNLFLMAVQRSGQLLPLADPLVTFPILLRLQMFSRILRWCYRLASVA